jgi:hypothetical protein
MMALLIVTSSHSCSLPNYFGENFATFRFTVAIMALQIVTSPHPCSLPYYFGENFASVLLTVAMVALLNVTHLTPVPCLIILLRILLLSLT